MGGGFWNRHSRNLTAAGLCAIICIACERINGLVLRWVELYPSMQTAGMLLTFLVGLAALLPWQSGRFRKWAGFALTAVAVASFFTLNGMLKSPGYSWLNRSAAEKALPMFYGLIFAAPAWSLKALVIGKLKPEGVSMGNQELLPPAEGLHHVNVPDHPEFNIVFLHGVHGHHFTTWCKDADRTNYWPQWLSEYFPRAAVYSAHYNAYLTKWKGSTMPLTDRAVSVLNMCKNANLFARPTVFVVHSYGGLVLKEIWQLAHERDRERPALDSVRGVIFLATPHAGSGLGNFVRFVRALGRTTVTADDLKRAEPQLRKLNIWYRDHPIEHNFVYYETQPTPPLNVQIVDESSADPGIPHIELVPMFADHISICKPENRGCEIDASVRRNITEIIETPRRVGRRRNADPFDVEIEIAREAGGKLTKFNVQLNDLYIAPNESGGIAKLLDEFESDPSDAKWEAVKERVQANKRKLENLYQALSTLNDLGFFGRYPGIPNGIERVIDAKMHSLYGRLESRPRDPSEIADLKNVVENCVARNKEVEELQDKISAYLTDNEAYLKEVVRNSSGRARIIGTAPTEDAAS